MYCTLEKDGFIGTFYPGTRYKEKGIILVGGSGEKQIIYNEIYEQILLQRMF